MKKPPLKLIWYFTYIFRHFQIILCYRFTGPKIAKEMQHNDDYRDDWLHFWLSRFLLESKFLDLIWKKCAIFQKWMKSEIAIKVKYKCSIDSKFGMVELAWTTEPYQIEANRNKSKQIGNFELNLWKNLRQFIWCDSRPQLRIVRLTKNEFLIFTVIWMVDWLSFQVPEFTQNKKK